MQYWKLHVHIIAAICLFAFLYPVEGIAEETLSRGQLLYIPVYWKLPYGARGSSFRLTVTLSVGNTDRKNTITVKRVDYYSATGHLIDSYLKHSETLQPMASYERIIGEFLSRDIRG